MMHSMSLFPLLATGCFVATSSWPLPSPTRSRCRAFVTPKQSSFVLSSTTPASSIENLKADYDNDGCSSLVSEDDTNVNQNQPIINIPINYGLSDTEFEDWVKSELFQDPLYEQYTVIFERAATAITKWRQRYRGNPKLWRRLFKKDRVFKEFVEAVPIIHAVVQLIEERDQDHFTVIDLASGKGYLSMFLSEMLPPEKMHGLVLMDKAWPMQNQPLKDHHISWEHIYGTVKNNNDTTTTSTATTYYETWPIPLVTSRQNLKQKCTHRSLQKRFFNQAKGPIILLAVHLCGTLSLRAVDMFNQNPDSIAFFALKPCCLPPMVHAQQDEVFALGRHHTFSADLVCSNGRFNAKRWYGPPRRHLEHKFQTWAENLFLGVDAGYGDDNNNGNEMGSDKSTMDRKSRVKVTVQREGGYQNAYIFAQRDPVSNTVWDDLRLQEIPSFLEEKKEG